MNLNEIVSTLEELALRVNVLEKKLAALKSASVSADSNDN